MIRVSAGGTTPISLTTHRDLLYVLNAGGAGNISGFRIQHDGSLTPLYGSSRPLSSSTAGPAQIGFDRDGDSLVVTEKNTNRILTFPVRKGIAGNPTTRSRY